MCPVGIRRRKGEGEGRVEAVGVPGDGVDSPPPSAQPWYELAREGAQIVVSALALYASVKSFLEKLRRRREEKGHGR
jgi:hypothetical protein